MRKDDRIFVDGLNSIRIAEGVVHLEFYNKTGSEQAPAAEPCGEIVMTRQAFFTAFNTMEELVNKMVKAGIVKRRSEGEPAPGSTENSPNFQ